MTERIDIFVPSRAKAAVEEQGLVLPDGSLVTDTTILGRNVETGGFVQSATCIVRNKRTGRETRIALLFDEAISEAHAEDMMATAVENFHRDAEAKGPLANHTVARRQEIGHILEDFRIHAKRRRESSNGVLHYKGTNT